MSWRLRLLLLAPVFIFVMGALVESCTSNSSNFPLFIPPPAGFNLDSISVCEGPGATSTPTPFPTPKTKATPTVTPCPGISSTSVPAAGVTVAFHSLGNFSKGKKSETLDITNSPGTLWTSNDPAVLEPPAAGDGGQYFAATPGCACANASSGGITSLPVSVAVATGACPVCPTPLPTETPTPKAASTASAVRPEAPAARSAGVMLWMRDAGAPITGNIAASSDGAVFFVTGDGVLHALDSAAHPLFTRSSSAAEAPVTAPDGTVYAADASGDVFALAPNGGTRWRAGLSTRATPLAASHSVVIAGTAQELIALGASGTTDWPVPIAGATAAIALANDGFVVETSSAVTAVAADGAIQWSFAVPGGTAGAPAASESALYVASRDGMLYALDASTGAEQWHLETAGPAAAGPVVASSGAVYFASDQLYALAPDGQLMWSGAVPGGPATSLTAVGAGGALVTSSDGAATAISQAGAILWSARSFGDIQSVAASPDGVIYIASKAGKIFAVK